MGQHVDNLIFSDAFKKGESRIKYSGSGPSLRHFLQTHAGFCSKIVNSHSSDSKMLSE